MRCTTLVAQRVFGIACGYADGNDGDRLADDPIQKLLLDRHPVHGQALASQPTVSRFENGAGPRALYHMGRELAAGVIDRHRRRLRGRARRITIDLDVTDDPTHGAQQLTFFRGHYDTWCYLPLLAFLTFDDEADLYLCAAVLRPGNAATATGADSLLKRLIVLVRHAFPGGPAARPPRGRVCPPDAARRPRHAGRAAPHRHQGGGPPPRRPRPARQSRFVITNLQQMPRWIYEQVYCQRGEIENRIKELHHGLEIDRTSCTRFWANQLRVLLTAAAYVLLQEIRWQGSRVTVITADVSELALRHPITRPTALPLVRFRPRHQSRWLEPALQRVFPPSIRRLFHAW